ncbi:NUDIX domain-containing protein [Streptomyces sp. NPDC055055]
MSTTEDAPDAKMTDEEYGAHRAARALWAGASVLITNVRGEVLVEHVDYLDGTCLLPGGAVDPGESPARAAARELVEELGVSVVIDRGLAVDHVSPEAVGAPPEMRFPGEILHVFDGGVWDAGRIAAIRLPGHEVVSVEFVEPARLPDLLYPRDARRALSALRARVNAAGPVLLEDGRPLAPTVLDRTGVLRTPRARHHHPFHPAQVPDGVSHIRQSWGWVFAPDGRVLVLLAPDTGAACLPGGTPEPDDRGDPVATLRREAAGKAAAELASITYVGYLSGTAGDSGEKPRSGSRSWSRSGSASASASGAGSAGPYARVRYAALLKGLGEPPGDPATGRTHVRILATPEQALEFFDWGPSATEQLAAVHRARERLRIPRAARRAVTELPGRMSW